MELEMRSAFRVYGRPASQKKIRNLFNEKDFFLVEHFDRLQPLFIHSFNTYILIYFILIYLIKNFKNVEK